MKKAILGLAFLTIASVSFSASAQQKTSAQCANTECASQKNCNDIKCPTNGRCGKQKTGRTCPNAGVCALEGLNLTDTQKGQIEALNQATKTSRQELANKVKSNNVAKNELKSQRKAIREQYVKDLGNILTPDQYVKFLQNYYVNNSGHQKRMGKAPMKGHKGHKGQMRPSGQRSNQGAKISAQIVK